MRKQSKTVKKSLLARLSNQVAIFAAVAVLLAAGVFAGYSNVFAANSTCNSIADCNAQISASRNAVANLRAEAVSYQDAVARLNGQISILQGQIDYNTAEQARITNEIAVKQAELDRQREILASDLKAMYVDDQMTTIEMIATSKNLSEYVDKEAYRSVVQSKIQSSLKEIAALQAQLKSQKDQVEALLSQQRAQQAQLSAARAEQASLLAYNQSQQASYNAQTSANQRKLDALIAAQRAANNDTSAAYYFIRFPGAVHDFNPYNYPYANSGFGMSTAPGCVDNDGPDEWGYCTRQCVSYAAWAVEASGRSAPRYYGNAKDWIAAARVRGIPVYTSPQPGDIAISTAGTWGHAMYVEQVSGNQIYVSQYNQQLTGRYSTQWRTYR